jgi:hypothetical protein
MPFSSMSFLTLRDFFIGDVVIKEEKDSGWNIGWIIKFFYVNFNSSYMFMS